MNGHHITEMVQDLQRDNELLTAALRAVLIEHGDQDVPLPDTDTGDIEMADVDDPVRGRRVVLRLRPEEDG